MLASGAAGLLVAFALQGSFDASEQPSAEAAPIQALPTIVADPESLERLYAWCDEAAALTPTEVWLDERAQEQWLFRRPDLEAVRDDAAAPEQARAAARQALGALGRLGL